MRLPLPLALLATVLACAPRDDRAPAADPTPTPAASVAAAPAPVPTVEQLVDSSLRAFRDGVAPVTALDGGAESRDALVSRYAEAALARDTAALRALLVTRAEFAWLYFPESRLARPPYGIDPTFLWLQVGSNSTRDLPKAMTALAGGRYAAHLCQDPATAEGANRLHEQCRVVVTRGARADTLSLFGSILERGGRFKFLSYANRL
ncbi:hypothetical protein [Roseisolibacter sp. H3M3-2]|uniref:hypothetical protein n=1 Tax=Roseisolibacter sp. H3M3-2 TaxID=3031323 RepID=UPI0023DCDB5E|nr:hypothetical protein [Roseisolibacter sp. H3M3-2]MDF1501913.1 hypothetical protein [Roseisolibacter sp. H3M3-2]